MEFVIAAVSGLVALLAVWMAYRQGVRDGRRRALGLAPDTSLFSKKNLRESRTDRILKNIELYNGTSKGQKKL